jgi:hypothetical protein
MIVMLGTTQVPRVPAHAPAGSALAGQFVSLQLVGCLEKFGALNALIHY